MIQRCLLLACLLFLPTSALAECLAPRLTPGVVHRTSKEIVFRTASLPLADFVPARMACLGTKLSQEYRTVPRVLVYLFSSESAAATYPMMTAEFASARSFNLHGTYVKDSAAREEYVEIKPLGGPSIETGDVRIDAPFTSVPPCELRLFERCLLRGIEPHWPGKYEEHVAGSITLNATVRRDGTISAVRVASATSTPPGVEPLFAKAAVDNLMTWQLQSVEVEQPFMITYEFKLDDNIGRGDVDVSYSLPSAVVLRFHPLR
jgi:hypothetical protein